MKNYPLTAKVIGLTPGVGFEMQDDSFSLMEEHMDAIEAKFGDHAAKKQEWKTQREMLESTHATALQEANAKVTAAEKKVTEANAKVGEMTTKLDAANAKIESLENDPAEETDPAQTGAEGAGKTKPKSTIAWTRK